VQIIEFVTGNPKTWKTAGAAAGTASSGAAAAGAETDAVFKLVTAPSTGLVVAGCARRLTAKIAAKKAQANMILQSGFTSKMIPNDTDYLINQTNGGFENMKIASS